MDLANIQRQDEIEKQRRDQELSDMLSKLKLAERANTILMAETEEERFRNDRIDISNKLAQNKLEEELALKRSVTKIGNPSTLINQDRIIQIQADYQLMDTLPRLPAIDIPLSKANPNSFPDISVPRKTSTEPTSDTLLNKNLNLRRISHS